jgi:hypothetical protein
MSWNQRGGKRRFDRAPGEKRCSEAPSRCVEPVDADAARAAFDQQPHRAAGNEGLLWVDKSRTMSAPRMTVDGASCMSACLAVKVPCLNRERALRCSTTGKSYSRRNAFISGVAREASM